MPDLLTHVLFGMSIGLLVKKPVNRETIFLVSLGSIVIDVERPIGWLVEFMGLDAIGLTAGFHSLLGAVVLSFAAASAFENTESGRGLRFRMILLGALTHLLLDMTMGPWEENGIYLFYPLTIPFSFHLFWSDYPWYPVFGIIALCVVLLCLVITHGLKPNPPIDRTGVWRRESRKSLLRPLRTRWSRVTDDRHSEVNHVGDTRPSQHRGHDNKGVKKGDRRA